MNYILKIIFTVFDFDESSIIISIFSNGLYFNNDRNKDNEKKNKRFPSFEELLLDVGKEAQKPQQLGLRLDEDKSANTVGNSQHRS